MNSFLISGSDYEGIMPAKINITTEELDACADRLVKNSEEVKKWVTVADKYMQTKIANPEMYVLPKPHEFLSPMIEAFANNPDGFLEYILQLRDRFTKEDKAWTEIQSIYRRINGRYVQKARRERSARAITKAEDLFGETDFHSRMQWTADLEHGWAQRRLEFLDVYRSKYKSDRLDVDTRAEVLAEFWDMIDTEIHEGRNLPPWN
jgi:hypothetical protein